MRAGNTLITSSDLEKSYNLKPVIETGIPQSRKTPFISQAIRKLSNEEKEIALKINKIKQGKLLAYCIATIPSFASMDGKIRALILSYPIVKKVAGDHGSIPTANLVINANDWDYLIKKYHKSNEKINLIKKIPRSFNYLILSGERQDGYFMLTQHEVISKKGNKLKNLLHRSEVFDRTGRTPDPSIVFSDSVVS